MGHTNGKSFASYVSVRDDVQSAFMGTPARNALLGLACNASLTRDVSTPNDLDSADKKGIELDPELDRLKEATRRSRLALTKKWRSLQHAEKGEPEHYQNFRRLQNATRTYRKRLFEAKRKEKRESFFSDIGNRIIEGNHQGNPITFNADLSHMQPQRTALAELEFKNRETDKVDTDSLIQDRIRSLEMRLELNKLHVPKCLKKRVIFSKLERLMLTDSDEDSKNLKSGSWESETGLQCPFCLGHTKLDPAAREYSYSRKDALVRHFKTHRLPSFFPKPGRECDIPGCDTICISLPGYLLHVNKCHKVSI
jgi:hypothetical protein